MANGAPGARPRWAWLTRLEASPTLQLVAVTVIANDAVRASVAADPVTVWKVGVEHQAITTRIGNVDYKPTICHT